MKSVMVSIKPKWCELIASGEKTIEARKTAPKEVPFKCYIYCTEAKPDLKKVCKQDMQYYFLNGKVMGEFICDCVERLRNPFEGETEYVLPCTGDCCLSLAKLNEYGKGKRLYGWHISDLVIYDKPKELREFKPANRECQYSDLGLAIPKCKDCDGCALNRPPQSWMYVEVAE